MKLIKNTFLAALAVGGLLACGPALAQNASTNAPALSQHTNMPPRMIMTRGAMIVDRLAKTLNLTDAQKAQVEPIIDSQIQETKAVYRDASLSPADKVAKREVIREATDAKLKPILTDEQFAKWQSLEPHQGHPPTPPANTVAPTAPSAPSASPAP